MAESKSTLDDANKQTNEGANDDRLSGLTEEERDIVTKGGKATPEPIRHAPSQPQGEDEHTEEKVAHRDQRRQNSDDEINARGGLMSGTSASGARENSS